MNSKTNIFSYQQRAVDKLIAARVGALFMEMGTGKTRTAIEFVRLRRARIDRVLWFCPVSAKETIETEILKHTDLRECDVVRFDERTTSARVNRNALFYIVGTESMSSSNRVVLTVKDLITEKTFVIVDESDQIKGHNARRTNRITFLAECARYRMILTGTPLSQGVVDLFAQMKFLSTAILGYRSFYSFARNHLEYSDKFPGKIVRAHNTQLLAAKIQPYVYQVTKAECMDLPEKLHEERYYRMTDEQRDWYEDAKQEILMDLTGDDYQDSYVIFRVFTALQQIVSGFWHRINPKLKIDEFITFPHERVNILQSVLDGIPQDAKVIIWCKYLYSIERIVEHLQTELGSEAVSQFHGNLSERERSAELQRFRGDARFLVATASSGGRALTLNEAHYAVFYENSFKYNNRLQAEDRIHRIGQTQRVTYVDVICRKSIDERIEAARASKEDVVNAFKRQVERVKDDPATLKEMLGDL